MNPAKKPYEENRPWGSFLTFVSNSPLTVKLLTINPGQAFSLQHHQKRDEQWHIISGDGLVTIGKLSSSIRENGDYYISRGTLHRLEAGTRPLVVLEISFGEFDENDIIRLEDRYGRK